MDSNEVSGTKSQLQIPLITLLLGSLLVGAGAVYVIKTLSIYYGTGLGALVQAYSDGTGGSSAPVASSLQSTVLQLPILHTGILESYALLLAALIIVGSSFIMFIKRQEKGIGTPRRYTLLNGGFVVMYTLLLFVIFSDFGAYFSNLIYVYAVYFGVGLCFISDALIEYEIRKPSVRPARQSSTISIDPAKPFSNAITIQDRIFGSMAGSLRVIDKHFNSAALINFHRLLERSLTNFTVISILTSREMMDSDFASNLNDFRSELTEAGVNVEVRLLDDRDAVDQHERIMMDDRTAYKIPPFNIINKRSEHITRINFDESSKRFSYLYGRAIKLENYAIKKGRPPDQPV